MENQISDISRNSKRDGKTMERIRIIFADELPECECCGEPWCIVHMEHYAECDCIGPDNAEDKGYRLINEDGITYAIKP